MNSIELEKYLSDEISALISGALKSTFKNPKESAFFISYANSARLASKRRKKQKKSGNNIPAFLITSITGSCNLNCAGCYDKANNAGCHGEELKSGEWGRVFNEAEELGVSMILLAGGEPLLRMDIIEEAAGHRAVLFPVFTNGTKLSGERLAVFEQNRNLIPIISVEGGEAETDKRRGAGIYKKTADVMESLSDAGIFYGVSITVTSENLMTVTKNTYLKELAEKGCKVIIYVEYVPVDRRELALSENERDYLMRRVDELRNEEDIIIISFPGDEKQSGGCLAAGRGFFHINARGGAEPCPFSPYSDSNIKSVSLLEALNSPLFRELRDSDILLQEHTGGCTLFEKENNVKSIVNKVQEIS